MKSARINFGLPQSEYVAEVNDQGEAISFRNQDTGDEYVGGGGGLPDISAGDAGKVLTVSDELAAEWAAPAIVIRVDDDGVQYANPNAPSISELIPIFEAGIPIIVKAYHEDTPVISTMLTGYYYQEELFYSCFINGQIVGWTAYSPSGGITYYYD